MTDKELHERANRYARNIADDLGVAHWRTTAMVAPVDVFVRAVAIAFVVGVSAAYEDVAVKRARRKAAGK